MWLKRKLGKHGVVMKETNAEFEKKFLSLEFLQFKWKQRLQNLSCLSWYSVSVVLCSEDQLSQRFFHAVSVLTNLTCFIFRQQYCILTKTE